MMKIYSLLLHLIRYLFMKLLLRENNENSNNGAVVGNYTKKNQLDFTKGTVM